MNSPKCRTLLFRLIAAVFTVFIGMLAVMAVFIHCETNIYDYGHSKTITGHTPYLYLGLAVSGCAAVMLLCAFLERITVWAEECKKISRIVFFSCGAVIALTGIFWIAFNDEAPFYDQYNVYQEARRLAGALDEPYDVGYFSVFHRNRGIALAVAAAVGLFGDHLYSFQILNLLAVLVIYYCISKGAGLLFHNPVIEMLTSFLLMLFYPLTVYMTFIYGTLLSIAFTSVGLYAAAAWQETGKIRYAVMLVIAFPLGILMHQSAAIGLMAAAVYLLLDGRKGRLSQNIIIIVIAAGMVFGSMKAVNFIYTEITGVPRDADSIPVTCTIYMGLTSTEGSGGPGSQDGSYGDIFVENNRDGAAANRDAIQRILTVAEEYLTGERSLRFFLEKTEYQWLDPTFGARKIIRMESVEEGTMAHAEAFTAFYNSPFRTLLFKLSIGGMLLLYCTALLTGGFAAYDVKKYPLMALFQLYIIGGSLFQLLWESLSRYCLGYYIWLIPMSAAGMYMLYRRCRDFLASREEKRFQKRKK
ncbi:MAG: glycosyltransferase family 39 protein [Blautia sp.]|nr:glycosyltransferase family 39 protein [Blautia sp.]MCM1201427.1 glycosyltransferase family 39 protein [Bacteroides fragilis]